MRFYPTPPNSHITGSYTQALAILLLRSYGLEISRPSCWGQQSICLHGRAGIARTCEWLTPLKRCWCDGRTNGDLTFIGLSFLLPAVVSRELAMCWMTRPTSLPRLSRGPAPRNVQPDNPLLRAMHVQREQKKKSKSPDHRSRGVWVRSERSRAARKAVYRWSRERVAPRLPTKHSLRRLWNA